jgi:hypothetical protein
VLVKGAEGSAIQRSLCSGAEACDAGGVPACCMRFTASVAREQAVGRLVLCSSASEIDEDQYALPARGRAKLVECHGERLACTAVVATS